MSIYIPQENTADAIFEVLSELKPPTKGKTKAGETLTVTVPDGCVLKLTDGTTWTTLSKNKNSTFVIGNDRMEFRAITSKATLITLTWKTIQAQPEVRDAEES